MQILELSPPTSPSLSKRRIRMSSNLLNSSFLVHYSLFKNILLPLTLVNQLKTITIHNPASAHLNGQSKLCPYSFVFKISTTAIQILELSPPTSPSLPKRRIRMSSKLLNSSFLVRYSLLKNVLLPLTSVKRVKTITTHNPASATSKRTEQAMSLQFCFQNIYDSNTDISNHHQQVLLFLREGLG